MSVGHNSQERGGQEDSALREACPGPGSGGGRAGDAQHAPGGGGQGLYQPHYVK